VQRCSATYWSQAQASPQPHGAQSQPFVTLTEPQAQSVQRQGLQAHSPALVSGAF
jgi:hypothetical protein